MSTPRPGPVWRRARRRQDRSAPSAVAGAMLRPVLTAAARGALTNPRSERRNGASIEQRNWSLVAETTVTPAERPGATTCPFRREPGGCRSSLSSILRSCKPSILAATDRGGISPGTTTADPLVRTAGDRTAVGNPPACYEPVPGPMLATRARQPRDETTVMR